MQEPQVQSLSGEDPLEKGVATHSNILGWRIPWTEEPGRIQHIGLHKDRLSDSTTNITVQAVFHSHGEILQRAKKEGSLGT